MIYLTAPQVIHLHAKIIADTGGSGGIRDPGGIASAVAQPAMTFGGVDLYPTIAEKASALGFSLIGAERSLLHGSLSFQGAVPADDLRHIFDLFYRSQKRGGSRVGGMGVGLYISREIVSRHGGEMRMKFGVWRGGANL